MSPYSVRKLLAEKQGNKCCYCGESLRPVHAKWKNSVHPKAQTIEHLRRKADGGTGRLDNKALACFECNSGRGAIDWLTYKSIKMGEFA